MKLFFYAIWVSLIVLCVGCHKHIGEVSEGADSDLCDPVKMHPSGRGALLLSRFDSFDSLRKVIRITYYPSNSSIGGLIKSKPCVKIFHCNGINSVESILQEGIRESELSKARYGNLWTKISVAVQCPILLLYKSKLQIIELLGRRRPWDFGKEDVAFYDIAEAMVHKIRDEDKVKLTDEDLSEKGLLNTFNHITAQAFMTSFFSESFADFVADLHERQTMPELITGTFTDDQILDIENGVVDNYVDMINNEWGQELGKKLKGKYAISGLESLDNKLFSSYLNEILANQSWNFNISFEPFRPEDEIISNFILEVRRARR